MNHWLIKIPVILGAGIYMVTLRNNPLRFTDPSGRECVTLDNGTQGDDGKGTVCKAVTDADKNKKPDVTITDFEPPSPLLLAVAQGAQQAGPVVNAAGYATIGVMTGAGVGMALGTGATASLSMLAARAGGMLPIALPAGDKMRQMIARFGISGGPQALQQFASEFREKAIAAGTHVQGYYLRANNSIFRVGNDYLTVNSQGRMVSFVKDAPHKPLSRCSSRRNQQPEYLFGTCPNVVARNAASSETFRLPKRTQKVR